MQTLTKKQSQSNLIAYHSFSELMRPRTFQELLLPTSTISSLNTMLEKVELMNMIFYGPPGTGKTSCASIFSESDDFSVYKINAANLSSIDELKKNVKGFSNTLSMFESKKFVLIDEADRLSSTAQETLRAILDDSLSNCRFILTTNEFSKIQDQLKSRCMPVSFSISLQCKDEMTKKLLNNIQSKLQMIDFEIDNSRVSEIVAMNFPDYRAIANAFEFELLAKL